MSEIQLLDIRSLLQVSVLQDQEKAD